MCCRSAVLVLMVLLVLDVVKYTTKVLNFIDNIKNI
jgi:hypothetical protein